ncbi:hypothetical protein JCM17843_28170 [Kordiimonadales bacterium JCM 17843]|nr:hypothetical protein JCM17843_28170 [Kordiimonadales bacterium JCM 17843]
MNAHVDDGFEKLRRGYQNALTYCFHNKAIILLLFAAITASIVGLVNAIPNELAPPRRPWLFLPRCPWP